MDIADLPDDVQPPKPRKKTAPEKMHVDMLRPMAAPSQIQELQDLVRRHSPKYPARELFKQFERERQLREMLERSTVPKRVQDMLDGTSIAAQAQRMLEHSAIPKRVQDMLDGTSIAAQAQRMLEHYLPKNRLAQQTKSLRRAAGLDSISEAANAYEKYLAPVTAQTEWLEKLQRQALGGLSVHDLARQLGPANPAVAAMEEAKKHLDTLWGSFRDIDFSAYVADQDATKETTAAAQSITLAASGEPTLKEAVDQIVAGIQAQQSPTVQLMLFLFFRKVMDWLIGGAIGVAMAYYAPVVLGESHQAASKAVKQNAREAVGAPEILLEYRYVSVKVLIVRQNPRARSPEVGRLPFGRTVKLIEKDKDFALVLWTDKESGAEIQGWVFSRYLDKFS